MKLHHTIATVPLLILLVFFTSKVAFAYAIGKTLLFDATEQQQEYIMVQQPVGLEGSEGALVYGSVVITDLLEANEPNLEEEVVQKPVQDLKVKLFKKISSSIWAGIKNYLLPRQDSC